MPDIHNTYKVRVRVRVFVYGICCFAVQQTQHNTFKKKKKNDRHDILINTPHRQNHIYSKTIEGSSSLLIIRTGKYSEILPYL